MENIQIAHDLAVARLYGSNLSNDELIKEYETNYEEILAILKSKPVIIEKAKTPKVF